MGPEALAVAMGKSVAHARLLLSQHREVYPDYWRWVRLVVDEAILTGRLQTVFGWRLHVGKDANVRSLGNYPCQANGAEMLRLACCLATERGIACLRRR